MGAHLTALLCGTQAAGQIEFGLQVNLLGGTVHQRGGPVGSAAYRPGERVVRRGS